MAMESLLIGPASLSSYPPDTHTYIPLDTHTHLIPLPWKRLACDWWEELILSSVALSAIADYLRIHKFDCI